jgi:hypothetical protein
MNRSGLIYAVMMVLLLGTVSCAAATPVTSSEDGLQQSVIALDRVRHQAVHDLVVKKQQESLTEKQQQDYEKFIVFLTVKIDEYCRILRTEESEAVVNRLPCPEGNQALDGSTQAESVQTSEEQVQDLERLFSNSLEQFDDKLLKEEERLSARQPRDRESGYSKGGPQGQAGEGQTSGTGQASGQGLGQDSGSGQPSGPEGAAGQDGATGETAGTRTAEGTTSSAAGTGEEGAGASGQGADSGEGAGPLAGGSGAGQTGSTSAEPGKVALDSSDDDVVARQLREAAENEKDPELKKKLWEEYRKYKEGVR